MKLRNLFTFALGTLALENPVEPALKTPTTTTTSPTTATTTKNPTQVDIIQSLGLVVIQEDGDKTLLIEDYVSAQVSISYKLPIIEDRFGNCSKAELSTLQAKIDADATFQMIRNEALNAKARFLAELRRKISGPRRRRTTLEPETSSAMGDQANKPPTPTLKQETVTPSAKPIVQSKPRVRYSLNVRPIGLLPPRSQIQASPSTTSSKTSATAKATPVTSTTTRSLAYAPAPHEPQNIHNSGICGDSLTNGVFGVTVPCELPKSCCNQNTCSFQLQRDIIQKMSSFLSEKTC
jgi:hypothetical protein